jgi:hypothetical protein
MNESAFNSGATQALQDLGIVKTAVAWWTKPLWTALAGGGAGYALSGGDVDKALMGAGLGAAGGYGLKAMSEAATAAKAGRGAFAKLVGARPTRVRFSPLARSRGALTPERALKKTFGRGYKMEEPPKLEAGAPRETRKEMVQRALDMYNRQHNITALKSVWKPMALTGGAGLAAGMLGQGKPTPPPMYQPSYGQGYNGLFPLPQQPYGDQQYGPSTYGY